MNSKTHDTYVAILRRELISALGCTEPIAIAYAAAKARQALGEEPESLKVFASGNVIKNVKGVTVPNSGGMMGIAAAAALGALGGDPDRKLEVLETITPAHIATAQEKIAAGYCTCQLVAGIPNLYIRVHAYAGADSARVEIVNSHTNITKIIRNDRVIFQEKASASASSETHDKSLLNVKAILAFAQTVNLADVEEVIERQIACNSAIAEEGLKNPYGAQVGRTLIEAYGAEDVAVRARAHAAAGSDARMGGCNMPVVINSGSGNQGITVSVPVIEYAKALGSPREALVRALVLSNLISLLQKRYIGSLSAYCGAVSAGAAAACGVVFLQGGGYDEIARTITNALANVAGIVCDGAKASCAAKISSAVEAGLLGVAMAQKNRTFAPGQGLVKIDVESTIASFGRMGREGMKETDLEIFKIMLEPEGSKG